ncbi:thiamine diphosphokinase [Sphingobacterium sp. SGG-5]|uniref:thiamine diphosphokinase n=1 Tax=Sphingobacterium sp. SGG-5 TaxID=2710881 RepID=UPI0013EB1251|nr:thiamine diphosphokinase [Sphingobacterium sp. SGG-5]NGM61032.1 thiamine diphosphokinase [Sphingobacterium sp. SGG-5]
MSSHHIVRENQEPALLVVSSQAIHEEWMGQLLEWSPTILTDVENMDYLLMHGIKIDVVFGDPEAAAVQEAIKIEPLPRAVDPIHQALRYLMAHDFRAVNILTNSIPQAITSYADRINIVMFCQHRRYVFVRHSFEKWKPRGEKMYIDESIIKSFQGLNYEKKGVFKTTTDGFVTLEFSTDSYVMIGEDIA